MTGNDTDFCPECGTMLSTVRSGLDAAEGRVTVKQKDDSHSDSKVLE